MGKLVWSKYNYIFEKKGEWFLYNSLSNSFAQLPLDLGLVLKRYNVGDPIKDISENLLVDLRRMKAFVVSDETERLKIKYHTQKVRFSQSHLSLTICPTLNCNFRCSYCFEKSHPLIDMTDDVENHLIDFIKSHSAAKSIGVTWFGGEPLMQFHRIESLSEKIMSLNKPYSAAMITNGFLLNEKIAEKLSSLKIGKVQITIDGLAPTHNKRRFLRNGGATYQQIIENIDRAVKVSPSTNISIRVNIDNDNQNDYISIHNYIKEQNWRNVTAYPAFVGDYSEGNCGFVISANCRKKLLERYADSTGEIYPHFYPSGFRSECAIRNLNTHVIGPEGEIYKCWNDVGCNEKIVGNIDGKILNEDLLFKYLTGADPLENKRCHDCILFPVCTGGCPYERLSNMPEENNCPLIKDNLEDFLWRKFIRHKKFNENSSSTMDGSSHK